MFFFLGHSEIFNGGMILYILTYLWYHEILKKNNSFFNSTKHINDVLKRKWRDEKKFIQNGFLKVRLWFMSLSIIVEWIHKTHLIYANGCNFVYVIQFNEKDTIFK